MMKHLTAPSALLLVLASSVGCGSDCSEDAAETFSAEVAACTAAARDFAALCVNDMDRKDQVALYERYCPRASEPAAAAAALDCLRDDSSSVGCAIFSDTPDDSTCVARVLAPFYRPQWMQILSILQDRCGADRPPTWTQIDPPLVLLSERQLAAVAACLPSAVDCSAAEDCLPAGPDRLP